MLVKLRENELNEMYCFYSVEQNSLNENLSANLNLRSDRFDGAVLTFVSRCISGYSHDFVAAKTFFHSPQTVTMKILK